jgi:hypothetical protein
MITTFYVFHIVAYEKIACENYLLTGFVNMDKILYGTVELCAVGRTDESITI